MRCLVQFLRRRQVAPERLFDDHARILSQSRLAEALDHRFEKHGRNRQIECGPLCFAQRFLDCRERCRILVIAAHILEQRKQPLERFVVIDAAGSFKAVFDAPVQPLHAPLRKRHAHQRNVEHAPLHHGIERRESHLVRQVAGDSKQHQRVGMNSLHQAPPFLSPAFSSCPPN